MHPPWFHQDEDEDSHKLIFTTTPTPHGWNYKGNNIGDGTLLVPPMDLDFLHDIDDHIAMLLANFPSTCLGF